jgi:2-succinyl-5-enolpyruvyl-6-hydroxy-3-cyclohexene-1-carboxylate synthase
LTEWLRGVPSILADPGGQWRDPTQDARICSDADPRELLGWLASSGAVEPDTAWRDAWAAAEELVGRLAAGYLDRAGWCEPQAIRTLIGALPAGAGLFSGNSLPVRQLDTWSGTRGAPLAVHCNRGASGIEGNVSTLAGLNAGGQPTLGLIGDLALAHDLNGLLQAGWLSLPLIVINNGGGRIFDYLPQHGLPGFTALWRTPVDLDLTGVARLFRVPHRLAHDAEGFAAALEEALGASVPGMIELRVDAELSRRVHQGFWGLMREAALVPA